MIKTLPIDEFAFKNRVEELAFLALDKIFKPDIIKYEPITMGSPGGTYKPDFLVVVKERLMLVEVKSSWRSPGASRTKRSLKEIQQTYNWLGFFVAMLPEKKHQKDRLIYVDEWRFEIIQNGRFRLISIEELKEML